MPLIALVERSRGAVWGFNAHRLPVYHPFGSQIMRFTFSVIDHYRHSMLHTLHDLAVRDEGEVRQPREMPLRALVERSRGAVLGLNGRRLPLQLFL